MTNSPSSAGNGFSLPAEHDSLALEDSQPGAASPHRHPGRHEMVPTVGPSGILKT